jgi:hypothetical protein
MPTVTGVNIQRMGRWGAVERGSSAALRHARFFDLVRAPSRVPFKMTIKHGAARPSCRPPPGLRPRVQAYCASSLRIMRAWAAALHWCTNGGAANMGRRFITCTPARPERPRFAHLLTTPHSRKEASPRVTTYTHTFGLKEPLSTAEPSAAAHIQCTPAWLGPQLVQTLKTHKRPNRARQASTPLVATSTHTA